MHKSSENKGSPKQNSVFNKVDRAVTKTRIKVTICPAPWRDSDHSDAGEASSQLRRTP